MNIDGGVGQRIVDQRADRLLETKQITRHDDRGAWNVDGDLAPGLDSAGVVRDVVHQAGEIDLVVSQRPVLIEVGQEQQVAGEILHP